MAQNIEDQPPSAPADMIEQVRPQVSPSLNGDAVIEIGDIAQATSERNSLRRGQGSSSDDDRNYKRNHKRTFRRPKFPAKSIPPVIRRRRSYESVRALGGPLGDEADILRDVVQAPKNTAGKYGYSKEEQYKVLYQLANESHRSRRFALQGFDRLTTLCLLHYQHKLIEMEKHIDSKEGVVDDEDIKTTKKLLADFASLISTKRSFSTGERVGLERTKAHGDSLARKLHETRYWTSPDALNIFDASFTTPVNAPDAVRKFLQKQMPIKALDQPGRDRRAIELEKRSRHAGAGTTRVIQAFESQPLPISPATDKIARIVVGLIGCLFLLVPMTIMTFLPSENIKVTSLIVTIIAVVLFALIMSVGTKATNQELLAATAAYTAVLVVFVGSAVAPQ